MFTLEYANAHLYQLRREAELDRMNRLPAQRSSGRNRLRRLVRRSGD